MDKYLNRVRVHTDSEGYTRTFDYDTLDRVTMITHPDNTTEGFSYVRRTGSTTSPCLDMTAAKDRADRVTRTVFNAQRQPSAFVDASGQSTLMEWCLCGQLQKLTDPLGRVTQWKWAPGGYLLEKMMPDGVSKTSYTYEPFSGRLSTLTRPKDQGTGSPTVSYRYVIDGRLHREDYTASDTPDVSYSYSYTSSGTSYLDNLGRLRSVTDGIGTHTMNYRSLETNAAGAGLLSSIDGPLANDDLVYGHDWQNRVVTRSVRSDATTPVTTHTETVAFDSLGRLQSVTNALGVFGYQYPGTQRRPVSMTGPLVNSAFSYLANSAPGHSARALNGISHTLAVGGAEVAGHTYGYDKAGRMTSWQKRFQGSATINEGFDHNLRDELVEATRRDASANLLDKEVWGLDTGGNWLSYSKQSTGMTQTRAIDVMNRLTRIGGAGRVVTEGHVNELSQVRVNGELAQMRTDPVAGGYRFQQSVDVTAGSNTVIVEATDQDQPPNTTTQTWEFTVPETQRLITYDANGNTLTGPFGSVLAWDAKDRLIRVTRSGINYEWDYDYRDRRVREYMFPVGSSRSAQHKQFIWFEDDIVQERRVASDGSVTIARNHFHGGFTIPQSSGGVNMYQTLTDHLGNVREIVDIIGNSVWPAGTVLTRYDYSAYQAPKRVFRRSGTTIEATFQTIGRYYHHEASGLELAMYRAYDAELGRWLSEDPLGEEGGLNLYEFVGNVPSTYVDDYGLQRRGGRTGGVRDPMRRNLPRHLRPMNFPIGANGARFTAPLCRLRDGKDRHHPIPKVFGGDPGQDLLGMNRGLHQDVFHSLLRRNTAQEFRGQAPPVGGRGGGRAEWANFLDSFDKHMRAANALLRTCREVDQAYGTNTVGAVWERVMQDMWIVPLP